MMGRRGIFGRRENIQYPRVQINFHTFKHNMQIIFNKMYKFKELSSSLGSFLGAYQAGKAVVYQTSLPS